MPEQLAAPIDHSMSSAMATRASGAAHGATKGWLLGGALWTGSFGVLGTVAALAVGLAVGHLIIPLAIVGGLVGLVGGFVTHPLEAVPAAFFGSIIGAFRGNRQVSNERASAQSLQTQVDAYKMQLATQPAATTIYTPSAAPDAAYTGFPAQGSAMNMAAASGIQTGQANMQYQGVVGAGQQQDRAR